MTVRVAQHYAVGRFRDTPDARYEGVDGDDRPVTANRMALAVVGHKHASLGPARQGLVTHAAATNEAWNIFFEEANGFRFSIRSQPLSDPESAVTTIATADVLRDAIGLFVLVAGFENEVLSIRVNGVEASASIPADNVVDDPTSPLTIGNFAGGGSDVARDFSIVAFLGTRVEGLSLGDLASYANILRGNLRHGRALNVASPVSLQVYYDAADLAPDASSWVDRLGNGSDLSRNGAPELFSVKGRTAA